MFSVKNIATCIVSAVGSVAQISDLCVQTEAVPPRNKPESDFSLYVYTDARRELSTKRAKTFLLPYEIENGLCSKIKWATFSSSDI